MNKDYIWITRTEYNQLQDYVKLVQEVIKRIPLMNADGEDITTEANLLEHLDIFLNEWNRLEDLEDEIAIKDKVKDKVIDLMIKEISMFGKSIEIINLFNNVSPDSPMYDLVKEYFYKKVEEKDE